MDASDSISLNLAAMDEAALSPRRSLNERVAALYEANRDGIYRFLVGQGLEPAVAQELTQDVFVDLFVALQRGADLKSEQGWLYAVAARSAVDYWRRHKRPIWVELDLHSTAADLFPSQLPSPEYQTAQNERLHLIANGLRRLSKEHRLCIHLRMQGLRYREIAKILGVSTSTAAEWISTALDRLRGEVHD
jgi:RNA polymerase sigma-70 factor (ECF subfamily)